MARAREIAGGAVPCCRRSTSRTAHLGSASRSAKLPVWPVAVHVFREAPHFGSSYARLDRPSGRV